MPIKSSIDDLAAIAVEPGSWIFWVELQACAGNGCRSGDARCVVRVRLKRVLSFYDYCAALYCRENDRYCDLFCNSR